MPKTAGPQGRRDWKQYTAQQRQAASAALHLELPPPPARTGRRGRPEVFGEPFGSLVLTVALVFRLSDRRLQGMLDGLWRLAGARNARVPSLGWLSTMRQRIGQPALQGHAQRLRAVLATGDEAVLAIDSTGLSIRGAHAWRATRPYGGEARRKRTFLKLSIALDTASQQIAAWHLGPEHTSDPQVLPALLDVLQPDGRHPQRPAPLPPPPPRSGAASATEQIVAAQQPAVVVTPRTKPFRAHQPAHDRDARRLELAEQVRQARRARFRHLDPAHAPPPSPPPAIATVLADGAYDTKGVWAALAAHDVGQGVIRLSEDAAPWPASVPGAGLREQLRVLPDRQVVITPGSRPWRERTGYHRRSLVETAFSRLAAQCGNRLRARSLAGQAGEIALRLALLNQQMARQRTG